EKRKRRQGGQRRGERDRSRAGVERHRRIGAESREAGGRGGDRGGGDRQRRDAERRVVARAPPRGDATRGAVRVAAQFEGRGNVDGTVERSGDEAAGEGRPT